MLKRISFFTAIAMVLFYVFLFTHGTAGESFPKCSYTRLAKLTFVFHCGAGDYLVEYSKALTPNGDKGESVPCPEHFGTQKTCRYGVVQDTYGNLIRRYHTPKTIQLIKKDGTKFLLLPITPENR